MEVKILIKVLKNAQDYGHLLQGSAVGQPRDRQLMVFIEFIDLMVTMFSCRNNYQVCLLLRA